MAKAPEKPEVLKRSSTDRLKSGLGITKAEDGFAKKIKNSGLVKLGKAVSDAPTALAKGAKGVADKTGYKGVKNPKTQVKKGVKKLKGLVGMADGGMVTPGSSGTGTMPSAQAATGTYSIGMPTQGTASPRGPAGMNTPPQRPQASNMQQQVGAQMQSSGAMILQALQRMMQERDEEHMGFGGNMQGGTPAMQTPQMAQQPAPAPAAPAAPGGGWLGGFQQRWTPNYGLSPNYGV